MMGNLIKEISSSEELKRLLIKIIKKYAIKDILIINYSNRERGVIGYIMITKIF